MTNSALGWVIPHRFRQWSAAAACAAGLVPAVAAHSLWDRLTPIADLRYRFEYADESGQPQTARGHTFRARAGLEIAASDRLTLLAEGEAVWHLGASHYNDTINGRLGYPVIADPETLELNRLQVAYAGDDIQAVLGRQRINLDNQRFVGGSAFRQNEQTFDALRLTYNGVPQLTIDYAFVARVNRVLGRRSPEGHFDGAIHLIDISYGDGGLGDIGAFAYLIDLDDRPDLSTATYGVRLTGSADVTDRVTLAYRLGAAVQSPYADSPYHGTQNYLQAEARLTWRGMSLTLGHERLSGDGERGFSMSLGSLHGFQGFADMFLTTPIDGIADTYLRVGFDRFVNWEPVSRLSVLIALHDFDAERVDSAYGQELDAELSVTLTDGLVLSAAYARFESHTPLYPDSERLWLTAGWSL